MTWTISVAVRKFINYFCYFYITRLVRHYNLLSELFFSLTLCRCIESRSWLSIRWRLSLLITIYKQFIVYFIGHLELDAGIYFTKGKRRKITASNRLLWKLFALCQNNGRSTAAFFHPHPSCDTAMCAWLSLRCTILYHTCKWVLHAIHIIIIYKWRLPELVLVYTKP